MVENDERNTNRKEEAGSNGNSSENKKFNVDE